MNTTARKSHGDQMIAQCQGQAADRDDSSLARVTIGLSVADGIAILEGRGWTIEPVIERRSRTTSFALVKPGQKLRADGGRFGTDYLWDLGEALSIDLAVMSIELDA